MKSIRQCTAYILPQGFDLLDNGVNEKCIEFPFEFLENPSNIIDSLGFVIHLDGNCVFSSQSVDCISLKWEKKVLSKKIVDNEFDKIVSQKPQTAFLSRKEKKKIKNDLEVALMKNALSQSEIINLYFTYHNGLGLLIIDTANDKKVDYIIKFLYAREIPPFYNLRAIKCNKSPNALLLDLFQDEHSSGFELDSSIQYADNESGEMITARNTDLGDENLMKLCQKNGYVSKLGLYHKETGTHFVLDDHFCLKNIQVDWDKFDDDSEDTFDLGKKEQEFQIKIIRQIFTDLIAAADGLLPDLFENGNAEIVVKLSADE